MKDLTASCDGTTNRHTNFEVWHLALRAEKYTGLKAPEDSHNAIPKVQLLGVDAAVDHTSETQVNGWKQKMEEISEVYNGSPLARRTHATLKPDDLVLKLHGMNGDHAEDQKKTFRLMGEWKDKATYQSLGEQELLSMLETSWDTLHPILEDAMAAKVERVGGLQRWESLTPHQEKPTSIMSCNKS